MSQKLDDAVLDKLWTDIVAADVIAMITRAKSGDSDLGVWIRPFPGASDSVKECISKLDRAFHMIDEAGYVSFSATDRLRITGHLWRYLMLPRARERQAVDELSKKIIHHADALAELISEQNWEALSPLDECFNLVAERHFLRELSEFTRDLLMPALKKPGAPPKLGRIHLICQLARVYRGAGGRVSASWSTDGESLSGGFPAFLTVIWEVLPSDARPPTALTFARLARQLPRDLRGQEITPLQP